MEERSAQQERWEKAAIVQKEEIYRGKTIALRCDTYRSPEGNLVKRDLVLHPGAVVLVPVTNEGDIIFVKQWRRAVNKRLIELPAGCLDPGETPAFCAQRELQEETGYRSKNLVPLGDFYSAPGFTNEHLYLFLALDLEPSSLAADEDECIDLLFLKSEQAEQMIASGEICDAKTIAGIYRYVKWLR